MKKCLRHNCHFPHEYSHFFCVSWPNNFTCEHVVAKRMIRGNVYSISYITVMCTISKINFPLVITHIYWLYPIAYVLSQFIGCSSEELIHSNTTIPLTNPPSMKVVMLLLSKFREGLIYLNAHCGGCCFLYCYWTILGFMENIIIFIELITETDQISFSFVQNKLAYMLLISNHPILALTFSSPVTHPLKNL